MSVAVLGGVVKDRGSSVLSWDSMLTRGDIFGADDVGGVGGVAGVSPAELAEGVDARMLIQSLRTTNVVKKQSFNKLEIFKLFRPCRAISAV